MKHYTYWIIDTVNAMYYHGVHSDNDPENIHHYSGSSKSLTSAIQQYGISNFIKRVERYFDTREAANKWEATVHKRLDVKNHNKFYNNNNASEDFTAYNKVTVRDTSGNIFSVDKNDKRYISGELVHNNLGKHIVIDSNGDAFKILASDERFVSGELKDRLSGKVIVKDENDNNILVETTDTKYLRGEYTHINAGVVTVKDTNGNTMRVSTDDPRYISGELVHLTTGRVTVKDKAGNHIQVDIDDPRIDNGEFTYLQVGKVPVKDENGTIFQVDATDPRYISGELTHHLKGISNSHKDRIWITNPILKKNKRVLKDDLDSWLLKSDWTKGRKTYAKIKEL
ncbi:GIY-YIG domain protein [Vibrio phage 2.275.O._10N.286.54.E11]|nr:GIY-YIG domain protein [Vibrio phage 2.275.O._10N.286.54.E11]